MLILYIYIYIVLYFEILQTILYRKLYLCYIFKIPLVFNAYMWVIL